PSSLYILSSVFSLSTSSPSTPSCLSPSRLPTSKEIQHIKNKAESEGDSAQPCLLTIRKFKRFASSSKPSL
ncbi:hypothetical protein DPEC_G00090910, partial [Dallia pectoralis]